MSDVRDLYQDVVLQRSRAPLHARRPAGFDGCGAGENAMCGDRVEVFVRRSDGVLADVGFEADGCAISLASADLMADAVLGLDDAGVRHVAAAFERMVTTGESNDPALLGLQVFAEMHAYPSRRRCATLAWQALGLAVSGEDVGRG